MHRHRWDGQASQDLEHHRRRQAKRQSRHVSRFRRRKFHFIIESNNNNRMTQGKVFSAVFSPDDPLTVAAAGSKAKVQVWDVGANAGARRVFSGKLANAGKPLKEKEAGDGVVGLVDDEEDSDPDEEDE